MHRHRGAHSKRRYTNEMRPRRSTHGVRTPAHTRALLRELTEEHATCGKRTKRAGIRMKHGGIHAAYAPDVQAHRQHGRHSAYKGLRV